MKCLGCDFEAPVSEYRYLYNARIDSSITLRQCPNCEEKLSVDELKGEPIQAIGNGHSPWKKSAGIEDLG